MEQFKKHGVYEKVREEVCWAVTGKGPIGTRWIDINKGDEILTWDIVNKCYHSGVVTSEYVYNKINLDGDSELSSDHYYHKIYVKWFKDTLKKEDLDKSIPNFISKYHTRRGTVFEVHT